MPKKKDNIQYAALPYVIRDDALLIMLITSRDTGRWIIPKGWPVKGLTEAQAAELEAFEEAGVRGYVSPQPYAEFDYLKRLADDKRKRCTVQVFPLRVEQELDVWPESTQRRREWVSPGEAALRVAEARLVEFFLTLAGGFDGHDPFFP